MQPVKIAKKGRKSFPKALSSIASGNVGKIGRILLLLLLLLRLPRCDGMWQCQHLSGKNNMHAIFHSHGYSGSVTSEACKWVDRSWSHMLSNIIFFHSATKSPSFERYIGEYTKWERSCVKYRVGRKINTHRSFSVYLGLNRWLFFFLFAMLRCWMAK